MIDALRQHLVQIEPGAHMLLTNFDFTLEKKSDASVAVGTLSSFGIERAMCIPKCFEYLVQRGYRICPPEVGVLLALKSGMPTDAPILHIGMDPILCPTETEEIFYVSFNGAYKTLGSMCADKESFLTPDATIALLAPS